MGMNFAVVLCVAAMLAQGLALSQKTKEAVLLARLLRMLNPQEASKCSTTCGQNECCMYNDVNKSWRCATEGAQGDSCPLPGNDAYCGCGSGYSCAAVENNGHPGWGRCQAAAGEKRELLKKLLSQLLEKGE